MKQVNSFFAHEGGVTSISFSPDGATLATGGYDCKIRFWRTFDWSQTTVLGGHRRGHVAFSPDGSLLVSVGLHSDAVIFDSVTLQPIFTLQRTGGSWDVVFTPDGSYLIISQPTEDDKSLIGTLEIFETKRWKRNQVLNVPGGAITGVAFLPDGATVATGNSSNGEVTLWSDYFSKKILTFEAHQQATWGITFAPNGQTLVTVGADKTIKIWDGSCTWMSDEMLLGDSSAETPESALCVAYSSDQQFFVTGHLDGSIRRWVTLDPFTKVISIP